MAIGTHTHTHTAEEWSVGPPTPWPPTGTSHQHPTPHPTPHPTTTGHATAKSSPTGTSKQDKGTGSPRTRYPVAPRETYEAPPPPAPPTCPHCQQEYSLDDLEELIRASECAYEGAEDEGRGGAERSRIARKRLKRQAFIAALTDVPSVRNAARVAGIGVSTAHDWRKTDSGFGAAWDAALSGSVGKIEAVHHRTAQDTAQGREATISRIHTLKRFEPEYRDTPQATGPLVTVNVDQELGEFRRAVMRVLGPHPQIRAALAAELAKLGTPTAGALAAGPVLEQAEATR